MVPTRRLFMAGLVLASAGCLIACSATESDNGSLPALPQSTALQLQSISTSLSSPVFMTVPPGDSTRLFAVEQGGLIRIINLTNNSLLATPFLNLNTLLSAGGERGLLGMAFDPQYVTNHRFYIFYTNTAGDIVIARYLSNVTNPNLADASSATLLLTVAHPNFSNHNGGMLAFGPDGCLYAGVGDGGSGGDPNNNGQNPFSLLGKLLRLNPDTGGACGNVIINPFFLGGGEQQVWSLGLRNPWRFSFDRQTGDLYIGDVGQNEREEINVSPGPTNAGRGLNYGWRLMEGILCFNPFSNCNPGNLTLPLLDYPHFSGACSITGGYVYRGAVLALSGTYFYADYCAGFVKSFRYQKGQPTEQTEWPLLSPTGGSITSFGEDAAGELYITTQGGGLFKFIPN